MNTKTLEYFFQKMDLSINKTISKNDEMYNYARSVLHSDEEAQSYYLGTGREVVENLIKMFLSLGIDPEIHDLLDFAAGYGRITRWLVPVFHSVTMSDLEQDMLDFQTREFGVKGFLSSTDPDAVSKKQEKFDVIFVFSLFTHLPQATWFSWLKSLAQLLRPQGLLIFSTHSYELFSELNPDRFGDQSSWEEEFVFWEVNETEGRLDTSVYGSNITKESFVKRCISETNHLEFIWRFKRGEFDRYHDIYVAKSTKGHS